MLTTLPLDGVPQKLAQSLINAARFESAAWRR
jgi:hypothetical protein